jgi:transcriptional regulator with XRE-family HTH domain
MTERELLKIFGANVKLYRVRSKWSQADLAEKINISINFLSDIETGKKWASPVTMVKFAAAFNIETYELLKPLDVLPDNYTNVIKKYTEDIHAAIEQAYTVFFTKLK